jgi:hypothetical protein
MTVPRIDAVGFCAHYSRQGDWAFEFALRLSQQNALQLNVFHFLSDPYEPAEGPEQTYTKRELARIAFDKERELRMYYDERAQDYLEVGFRLCLDDSWRELHRCLLGREFQVLVLAKPEPDAGFCGESIETFANRMVCPVIVVGPETAQQFQLNSRAALLIDRLGVPSDAWTAIETGQEGPASGPNAWRPGEAGGAGCL